MYVGRFVPNYKNININIEKTSVDKRHVIPLRSSHNHFFSRHEALKIFLVGELASRLRGKLNSPKFLIYCQQIRPVYFLNLPFSQLHFLLLIQTKAIVLVSLFISVRTCDKITFSNMWDTISKQTMHNRFPKGFTINTSLFPHCSLNPYLLPSFFFLNLILKLQF